MFVPRNTVGHQTHARTSHRNPSRMMFCQRTHVKGREFSVVHAQVTVPWQTDGSIAVKGKIDNFFETRHEI